MSKRPRRSTGFEAWMNAATTPMYVLDKRRRVTIFNHGCVELTGLAAEDVVGGTCDYSSATDGPPLDRLLGAICPPASVFDGQSGQAAAWVPHRDGHTVSRILHHIPLANRDGVFDRILTFILPIETPAAAPTHSAAQKLHAELASLRTRLRQTYGISTVIAVADAMHRVASQVSVASATSASVHLVGENGTGRQHLARVIHNESELRSRSFVPLDCSALTSFELLRTIRRLFDKQPGDTPQLPHLLTGTLFLKSVDAMPRDVQQILVEQWNPAEPDFPSRLMTSSGVSVAELADSDAILPGLLRLTGTVEIAIPPLRSRLDDLAPLAQMFAEQKNEGQARQIEGLTAAAIDELSRYHWPGNVAELEKVISEAATACRGVAIEPADLPMRFRSGMDARRTSPAPRLRDTALEPLLAHVESEHIRYVLNACNGNRAEAARLLGITRARLYRRIEQLNLLDPATDPTEPSVPPGEAS